ncbi:MAG TPA: hypothetical protein PK867_19440, partial [Pirellulales bacterium]|nr:hypothetical protein [Pirellulales bacterium]
MPDVDLKTLSYSEFRGNPREWTLDGLELGQVNLLVGKNATGKSRVINVITNLADQLQREQVSVGGQVGVGGGNYTLGFSADGQQLDYTLKSDNGEVVEERLTVDGV